jgi:DNA-binding LacI/PurR family transcriptional regulator
VPDDIEIVVFGEREMHALVGAVRIPTAIIPFMDVGVAAARMLIRLMSNGGARVASEAVAYKQVKLPDDYPSSVSSAR